MNGFQGYLLASRKRAPFWHFPAAIAVTGLFASGVVYVSCSFGEPFLALGLVGFISLFLVGYLFCWYFDKGYDYYEQGLTIHRAFSSWHIPIDEIESYRFHRIRVVTLFDKNPVFILRFLLSVKSREGRKRTVKLSFDEMQCGEMTFFRILKHEIASRLETQIKKEGAVSWTRYAFITASGIEKKYDGKSSEGVSSFLPCVEVERCSLRVRPYSWLKKTAAGCWRIIEIVTVPMRLSTLSIGVRYRERVFLEFYRANESRPELSLPCDSPNFYPGLEIIKKYLPGRHWQDELAFIEVK